MRKGLLKQTRAVFVVLIFCVMTGSDAFYSKNIQFNAHMMSFYNPWSFALMLFTDYILQRLCSSAENKRTLWCNGSASDSRSEGYVFKSHQGQCSLVQVLSVLGQ